MQATNLMVHQEYLPSAKRRVRVVHLTSVHRATDLRIFQRECRTLARNGYGVTLISPHDGDETIDGVSIKSVLRPKSRLYRMTSTLWQIYREAVRQDADLYHFHDPELIPVGVLLRAKGKQVIYDMHENVPHQILGGEDKQWIPRTLRRPLSWLFGAFERAVSRSFSAIVTANPEISQHAMRISQRVVLIGNYPDAMEFSAFNSDPARYASGRVLSFGGISFRTCMRQVVQAFSQLSCALPAELILAGAATQTGLADELSAMPGWTRVRYLGPQPRRRILDELQQGAMALVLFSRAPNHMGVGSNRFYEALASGLPVVVSDFPQWQEIIDAVGCGIAVNPDDATAISQAIEFLLTHPQEAAEMGRRGRQAFLAQYCWDAEQPKLLDLYEQLTAAQVTQTNARRVNSLV
jgi:glycosyltransferase involved in cell wall biosynthesis